MNYAATTWSIMNGFPTNMKPITMLRSCPACLCICELSSLLCSDEGQYVCDRLGTLYE